MERWIASALGQAAGGSDGKQSGDMAGRALAIVSAPTVNRAVAPSFLGVVVGSGCEQHTAARQVTQKIIQRTRCSTCKHTLG